MFKIVDFQHVDGKIRCLIEADDHFFGMLIRFVQMAQDFCILLDYKLKNERDIFDFAQSRPTRTARAMGTRADLLKLYSELPGKHSQRIKIIKEMFQDEGVSITQDRISAKLQLAREEEKEHQQLQINRLIRKGYSFDDIASSLGISRTTVARRAQKVRGARKRNARVKRTVLTLAERPPEPSPDSPPVENPASIPPGRPEIA